MKIYVASSWRNEQQGEAVRVLRENGHLVYDFKCPKDNGQTGFHWSGIDQNWQKWTTKEYIQALRHPLALEGFNNDWRGMINAQACLLVNPCGRSAHLEAGYFVGAKKPLIILITQQEPELMYSMADAVVDNLADAVKIFNGLEAARREQGWNK